MIAILLGPPGVGKGTQASLAAQSNGWKHLSTGDLLREEVAQGSELGKRADEFMSRGDLVPDELMLEMVAERVSQVADDEVLLLDGFPRTLPQAEALAARTSSGAVGLSLYFTAPDSVLTARLMGLALVVVARTIAKVDQVPLPTQMLNQCFYQEILSQ